MSFGRRRGRLVAAVLVVANLAVCRAAVGQATPPTEDPLAQRITVRFDGTDLAAALARLRTVFGVPLAFSIDAVPRNHPVSVNATGQPVRQVLESLLAGTNLRLVATKGGAVVITPADDPNGGPERGTVPDIATGIAQLDQIVVMGTPISGAPEREQPNAVSVVNGADLKSYHFSRTADLFRTALPGVILWDRGPSGPPAEIASVRGASSFTARGLKTYVDGVEVASPTLISLIDPRSIERIEVIRGPQGAALYGSDAINGVIQIVTHKGQLGEQHKIHASATAAAGPFDRQQLPSTMLRQDYAGQVSWGGPWSSFAVDGNLARVGATSDIPNTRSWNLHGAGQVALGSLQLSAVARGGQFDFVEDQIFRLAEADSVSSTQRPASVDLATVGVTAIQQLTNRWSQTLVAGFDRTSGAIGSDAYAAHTVGERDGAWVGALANSVRQPLAATHETASKTSLRYSTSLDASLGQDAAALVTFGVEHTRLRQERGAWQNDLGRVATLYDDQVRNTGTFLQGKLKRGPLVVNAGTRAEWSTAFGADYGTAWAPSIGASWAQPIGGTVLRFRAGWGRGIRPPEPGMSRGMATRMLRQEPNPTLAPESQAGIELGGEFFFAAGSYLRATWFSQRATDLIQSVALAPPPGAPTTYQFQNVGAIRNRGVELEAGLKVGRLGIDALFYTTNSVVEQVAPSYSGYLKVGDEPPELPGSAGSLRLSYARNNFQVAIGTSYLGSWKGYDWAGLVANTEAGNLSPTIKNYVIRYPAVFKPYLTLSLDVVRQFTAFANIDNLFNESEFERHNGSPPPGRSVLIGLEIRP